MAYPLAAAAAEAGMTLAEYIAYLEAEEAAAIAYEESGGLLGRIGRTVIGAQVGALGAGLAAHALGIHKNTNSSQARDITPVKKRYRDPAKDALLQELTSTASTRRQRVDPPISTFSAFTTNMPSKRGYYAKRKPYVRRRKYGRRVGSTKKTPNYSVSRIKNVTYSVAEKKYQDYALTMTAPNTSTWTFQVLGPTLAQGTLSNQRIGNQVFLRDFQVDMVISPGASFAGAILRCVIVGVKVNKNSVSAPGATDIWSFDRISSVRKPENIRSFSLFGDFTTVIPSGQSAPVPVTRVVRINKKISYNNNLGTAADLPEWCFWLACCAGSTTVNNLSCLGMIRARYIDL